MNNQLLKATAFITEYIGTPASLIIHLIWFGFWFVLKQDVGLLTNLVSLESIFLAIFIQISVNSHSKTSKAMHKKVISLQKQLDNK